MKTNQLKIDVAHQLSQRGDVVSNPDHPFLFSGPDLLLAVGKMLWGVFLIHVSEYRRLDDLLVRMALSRLAYHEHYRTALVIPIDAPIDPAHGVSLFLERHFDSVFHWPSKRLPLGDVRGEAVSGGPHRLKEFRQKTYAQAEVIYSESVDDIEYEPAPTSQRDTLASMELVPVREQTRPWANLIPGSVRTSHNMFALGSLEGFRVAKVNLRASSEVHPRITRYGRVFFELDHSLDNGIPKRTRPALNALLVNRIPIYRGDPTKWLRASAFAGVFLLRVSDDHRVSNKLQRLRMRLGSI